MVGQKCKNTSIQCLTVFNLMQWIDSARFLPLESLGVVGAVALVLYTIE